MTFGCLPHTQLSLGLCSIATVLPGCATTAISIIDVMLRRYTVTLG